MPQVCAITLGEGTSFVIGAHGVLADCMISGGGALTVHGQFFERQSPGIAGVRQLRVSSHGAVVSSVEQAADATRFSFEPGSRLRLKIVKSKQPPGQTGGQP